LGEGDEGDKWECDGGDKGEGILLMVFIHIHMK
jgi:hypothetical protein